MKATIRPAGIAVLLLVFLGGWAQAATVYEINSGWVSNGKVEVKVDTMREAHTWDEIGPFANFTDPQRNLKPPFASVDAKITDQVADLKNRFDALKNGLSSGKWKALVFTLSMRNDTNRKMALGFDSGGSDGLFRLRSHDQAEVESTWPMTVGEHYFDVITSGCGLSLYLQNGLPKKEDTQPQGTVTGRMVMFVPTGFAPESLYLKPGRFGDKSVVITIRPDAPKHDVP